MGIPEEHSIGVSTVVVRAIAKKVGKSNELAKETRDMPDTPLSGFRWWMD